MDLNSLFALDLFKYLLIKPDNLELLGTAFPV